MHLRLAYRWIGVFVLLAGGPVWHEVRGQDPEPANVMVEVRTLPVQTLRLSDFDPLRPERAPAFLQITILNDGQERDLLVEVQARTARYGLLVTGRKRLGVVAPMAVVALSNRDLDDYVVEDAGNELVQVGLERNVLPAGEYVFDVRVFDLSLGGSVPVAEAEEILVTENPGRQLDLLGPGTPFGQEPGVVPTSFPIFQWFSDARRFNFAVYEVLPHHRSAEDVLGSRPVFALRDTMIVGNVLAYPNFAEALRPGGTYAWQVEAVVETASGPMALPGEVFWFVVEPGALSTAGQVGGGAAPLSPFPATTVARVAVQPQEVTVQPGATFRFEATAYDAEDLPLVGVRPVWRVEPAGVGTIDEEGLFRASELPGVAAIVAAVGEVQDYATVFIEAVEDTLLARADTTWLSADSAAVADTTRGVHLIAPTAEQQLLEPIPRIAWQVAGADTTETLRFRVSVWPTEPDRPADDVPAVPPLFQQIVEKATTLAYPPGAPALEPGQAYLVQVDWLDAEGNVVARSAPVRFFMGSQARAGWALRRVWEQALRQGEAQLTLTLLAELRSPGLEPLDRQQLLATGVQVELEDGPWLQLSVPIGSLPALLQLPFLRVLTLPAPPWFSGTDHPAAADAAATPVRGASSAATPGERVGVAVFEFGFDVPRVRALLEAHGTPYRFFSFRRDRRLDGRHHDAAQHGATTVEALLDYLPGEAELYLFNFETELEFRAALRYAVDSLGVRVASSSVSWMDAYDHYDGSGYLFGPNLSEILGERTVMVAAAGNFAQSHWEGVFSDPDGDGLHNFTPADDFLTLSLSGDEVYQFLLSWDSWSEPDVDLDLALFDDTGQPLYDLDGYPVRSANRQAPGQFEKPVERISGFAPPYPGERDYRLQVRAHHIPDGRTPHFELYMYPWPAGARPVPVVQSSLASGLAVARPEAVVPVAAVDFDHSSQGPTNDGRVRPDFAADGVVRQGEVPSLWPAGTSFATPRVAAALALVFARHPDWTAAQAIRFLRSFVAPRPEGPEKDNHLGWGAIDFDRLRAALR
ncbi:MAG: hypothetical protein KatS3mg042_0428 [Rhodothermaceae bacterium]|nr:MAG: hypothetical protein KatS3mg042_0428 [Rhodothermaceae bacterium]